MNRIFVQVDGIEIRVERVRRGEVTLIVRSPDGVEAPPATLREGESYIVNYDFDSGELPIDVFRAGSASLSRRRRTS